MAVDVEQSSLKRWWTTSSTLAKIVVFGVLAVIGLGIAGAAMGDSSSVNPVIKARYPQWRAECEARATSLVEASGGMYTVGGNQWVSLVNKCVTAKADDQVPVP